MSQAHPVWGQAQAVERQGWAGRKGRGREAGGYLPISHPGPKAIRAVLGSCQVGKSREWWERAPELVTLTHKRLKKQEMGQGHWLEDSDFLQDTLRGGEQTEPRGERHH